MKSNVYMYKHRWPMNEVAFLIDTTGRRTGRKAFVLCSNSLKYDRPSTSAELVAGSTNT